MPRADDVRFQDARSGERDALRLRPRDPARLVGAARGGARVLAEGVGEPPARPADLVSKGRGAIRNESGRFEPLWGTPSFETLEVGCQASVSH